jgi:DNA polymerase-1
MGSNAWVQGTAADMMKIMLRNLHRAFAERKWLNHTFLNLVVHDEFVVETDEERVPEVQECMQSEIESAVTLRVPVLVQLGSGVNWGEAKH